MSRWQRVDGARLRELRLERMLSQSELARVTGTTQSTISLLECWQRMAQPRTVRKLADALEVKPTELLKED